MPIYRYVCPKCGNELTELMPAAAGRVAGAERVADADRVTAGGIVDGDMQVTDSKDSKDKVICSNCGSEMVRQLPSSMAFSLKGGGYYSTDNKGRK